MIRLTSILLMTACLAGSSGCISGFLGGTKASVNVFVDEDAAKISKVAIITFKAPTELIGKTVSDLLVTEILRTGEYELVERNELAAVLGETELSLAGLAEGRVVAAAEKVGADAVIFGTVDEYIKEAQKGRTYAVAALSVRMVDCRTGRVLWGASTAERARSAKTTMPEHGRAVVHNVAASLYKEWKKFYKQRKIIKHPTRARVQTPDDVVSMEISGISTDGLREVVITWNSVPEGADEVNVQRSETKEGPYEDLGSVSAARGVFTDSDRKNLKDDASYFYAVTAMFKDGMPASAALIVTGKTGPPPEPPANVAASTPEARVVQLEWEASDSTGVVEYAVDLITEDGPAEVGRTSGLLFADRGSRSRPIADSTKYFYSVRSINRVGAESRASEPVSITTRPPPGVVAGLRMNGELVRAVDLKWDRSAEDDVVKYNLYRGVAADAEFDCIATVKGRELTSFLDGKKEPGSLENNKAYWYTVSAVNGVGAEGGRCVPVKCWTRPPVPVVTGVAAQGGLPRSVLLKWNRVEDPKLGGYRIRSRKAGEEAWKEICKVEADKVEYVDRGGGGGKGLGKLEDGAEYDYQAAAYDIGGYFEGWSEVATAKTKPAPSVPQNVKAESGLAGKVRITWDAVPETDVSKYEIEVAVGGKKFVSAGVVEDYGFSDTIFDHEGLKNGVEYVYRVQSVDVCGLKSGWSDDVSAATRALPATPANIQVKMEAGVNSVVWDPPIRQVQGGPADGRVVRYRLWRKKLFSPEEHAVVDDCSYRITAEDEAAGLKLMVTAFDEDGLESGKSQAVDCVFRQ